MNLLASLLALVLAISAPGVAPGKVTADAIGQQIAQSAPAAQGSSDGRAEAPSAPDTTNRHPSAGAPQQQIGAPHPAPQRPTAAAACTNSGDLGFATPGDIISYSDARLDRHMADVAANGASWVRVPGGWDVTEPSPGTFDFHRVDRVVDAARRHGLKTLVILGIPPRWAADPARSHGPHPAPIADTGPWTTYIRRIAGHLGSRADAWEVWNEANHDIFWGGRPDRDRYAAYLRAAYPVLKEVTPAAPVLSGASVPHETRTDEYNAAAWMRYFYDTGTNRYFDAVALHPYMWHESFRTGAHDPIGGYLTVPGEQIRQIMVDHGEAGKQIWITEIGYPTAGFASYTEQQAADYLAAQLQDLRARPYVGPVFVYSLEDQPVADREGHFGLRRSDGGDKPGLGAMRRAGGCG